MRREALRKNYSGYCRSCSSAAVQEGAHLWIQRKRPAKPRVTSSGYTVIPANDIEPELLPMFRAMQNNGQPLLAHRWEMAKFLGRALEANELVDHRDGHKDNNHPYNLRIYLRGKQQPGSAPGHGTYYHEWQVAEREIRLLKAALEVERLIRGHPISQ